MYKEVVMVGDENGKRGSVWRKKMESSGGGLDFGFYGERWPQPDTLDYFLWFVLRGNMLGCLSHRTSKDSSCRSCSCACKIVGTELQIDCL